MKLRLAALSLVLLSLVGCSTEKVVGPSAEGSGFLTIQTEKNVFTWDTGASIIGIDGTIRNHSDMTFYANIGDAMNSSIDQPGVMVVAGSDGSIEKHVAARTWVPVKLAPAIEGTKLVVIRPGQTYHFSAGVWGPSRGTHRIRLMYWDALEDVTGRRSYQDVSNTFAMQ